MKIKKIVLLIYTLIFILYAIVLFPVCVLVYETSSFSFREIIAMFGIPFLAGIVLAYPFNQWAQKVHQSSNLFLFNAPLLAPMIFFWVFLVFGNVNHYNRYLVLLKQQEPLSINNNQTLEPDAYGIVKFKNIISPPELQNAFIFNRPNNTSESYSYNRSKKVRYIAAPIQFREQPDAPIQYWFASSYYDLETVDYKISEQQQFTAYAYLIRVKKDPEFYKKAIAEGLKTNPIAVANPPIFVDFILDFEEHKNTIKTSFFMYYGFYFILMIVVWVVSLNYLKRGLGFKK